MTALPAHSPPADRTRANTWPAVNERLDRLAQLRLRAAAAGASSDEISARIERLDHEWDFDRVLETEASLMGLLGLGLAVAADRRLLLAPGVVASMLLLHALYGWYPLLPLFRRLGVRTRDEIDRERYALKAVRGDFHAIPAAGSPATERAAAAWRAVCD
jgi:hypothetical protein